MYTIHAHIHIHTYTYIPPPIPNPPPQAARLGRPAGRAHVRYMYMYVYVYVHVYVCVHWVCLSVHNMLLMCLSEFGLNFLISRIRLLIFPYFQDWDPYFSLFGGWGSLFLLISDLNCSYFSLFWGWGSLIFLIFNPKLS